MNELRNVTLEDVDEMLGTGALLLDVRGDDVWAAGRAPGATHVALAELPDHLAELARGRTIVCVCRSGGRSARAARFLLESELDAVNLEGGMIAWAQRGRALECDGGDPAIA